MNLVHDFVNNMGENIPAPAGGGNFNLEEYMASIGRNPRPIVRREDIAQLPARRSLDEIHDKWLYLPQLMQYDGEWKVAVNSEHGGNSYFAAGKFSSIRHPNLY